MLSITRMDNCQGKCGDTGGEAGIRTWRHFWLFRGWYLSLKIIDPKCDPTGYNVESHDLRFADIVPSAQVSYGGSDWRRLER